MSERKIKALADELYSALKHAEDILLDFCDCQTHNLWPIKKALGNYRKLYPDDKEKLGREVVKMHKESTGEEETLENILKSFLNIRENPKNKGIFGDNENG